MRLAFRSLMTSKHVFDLHRQFTDTDAGRMVDGIGDRRSDSGESDLANPTGPEFVDLFV